MFLHHLPSLLAVETKYEEAFVFLARRKGRSKYNIFDCAGPLIYSRFTCPDIQTFGAASVIWGEPAKGDAGWNAKSLIIGAIGPRYQFSPGQRYQCVSCKYLRAKLSIFSSCSLHLLRRMKCI